MADQNLPVIAKFAVRRRAYLALDGSVLRDLPDFASDQDLVVSPYRAMGLARTFDLKAVSLQRTSELSTYATSLGQEAVAVEIASAMQQQDVLFRSYRDNAALLWRGASMEVVFWGGDERGSRSGPASGRSRCRSSGRRRRRRCLRRPSRRVFRRASRRQRPHCRARSLSSPVRCT